MCLKLNEKLLVLRRHFGACPWSVRNRRSAARVFTSIWIASEKRE